MLTLANVTKKAQASNNPTQVILSALQVFQKQKLEPAEFRFVATELEKTEGLNPEASRIIREYRLSAAKAMKAPSANANREMQARLREA
jgi:hypothetical protein